MNSKIDVTTSSGQETWHAELVKLREILLSTGLTEDLKWGQPCYALDGKNIALIHGFKESTARSCFTRARCSRIPKAF